MVVQRLCIAFVQARQFLHERSGLQARLLALGIAGNAQEILLAAHLRGERVALSDLIVAGAVPRDAAGACLARLVEDGHLRIDDGSIALSPQTAVAIGQACRDAGIDCG